jgi:hypothetical protein
LLPSIQRFEILYFADDPITAIFEYGAMLGNPFVAGGAVPHPRRPFAMLNIHVTLSDTVDLTDVSGVQRPLQTTVQELTGDWDGYQIRGPSTPIALPVGQAPTQELGHALHQTGIEGFRAISARVPSNRTLMVFPQNLQRGSSLEFCDHSGQVVHHIP